MQPQDILPVAGMDVGTLKRRFTSLEYRGGIIGKTGTLPGTDGGVSTLAGIVYTRDKGPVSTPKDPSQRTGDCRMIS